MQVNSMNLVILTGRVGQEPELKYTPSGTAVCNLSIATNEVFKKGDDKVDKTEWHNLVVWAESGERAAEWIKKGQLITITGKLKTESWENDQKEKRYKTVITVDSWTTLSKVEKESPKDDSEDDSLPF